MPRLEGCAHHLARLYNVIEQMGTRIARAVENQIEDDRGWHAELIRRLSIPVAGVRLAYFPENLRQAAPRAAGVQARFHPCV
jgi:hypothetical protein